MALKLGTRTLHPRLLPQSYLNHAAIGPPNSRVVAAINEVAAAYASEGVQAFFQFQDMKEALRAKVASLIGSPSPKTIAFVPNTTRGVTDIALCFPWNQDDTVLLFRGEFPANVTPWQRAAELHQLDVQWADLPEAGASDDKVREIEWLRRIEPQVRDARLVAISAVEFQTGLTIPLVALGEMCAQHDTRLFVDGIQACGIVPIDVAQAKIDFLSCGGHKWLGGIEGIGFLYVEQEVAKTLRPYVAGWLSHHDGLGFLSDGHGHLKYDRSVRDDASFVEGGMTNTVGAAAMTAAIDTLAELGVGNIRNHVLSFLDTLEQELTALGFESVRSSTRSGQSGILSFRSVSGTTCHAVFQAIDPKIVSCSIPDGHLRFSAHYSNSHSEIPLVVAEVKRALEAARGLGDAADIGSVKPVMPSLAGPARKDEPPRRQDQAPPEPPLETIVRDHFVDTADGWSLHLRVARDAHRSAGQSPLLIIPGYGMNPFVFRYHPKGTSLEATLVAAGHEVWTVSLRGQGDSVPNQKSRPGDVSLRDYVVSDLPAALAYICSKTQTGAAAVTLLGCSLGGSIAYTYMVLCDGAHVDRVLTMGSPLDLVEVNPMAKAAFRSPFLAGSIRVRNTRNWVRRGFPLLRRFPRLLGLYMNPDTIDLSNFKEMSQTVDDTSPELNRELAHWIRRKHLKVDGVNISRGLADVKVPLMAIFGNRDGIVAPANVRTVERAWGGETHMVEVGDAKNWYAHANLFLANDAPTLVFKPMIDWLATTPQDHRP